MAFGRKSLLSVALLAATAVPYAVTSTNKPRSPLDGAAGRPRVPAAEAATAAQPDPGEASPLQMTSQAAARLAGPPVKDLGEIFRFDVSTDWVLERWSRVLTQTAEAEIRGYRVPLVTGDREHDLAGSLTYYFGPEQHVERIAFLGATGDARALIALVTNRYGLSRKATSDPGLLLYQSTHNGKVTSELQVRTTSVVRAYNPNNRYTIELMLNRPSSFRMLTQTRQAYSNRLGP